MDKAEERFQCIIKKYEHYNFDYSNLDIIDKVLKKSKYKFFYILAFLVLSIFIIGIFNESSCLFEMPLEASKWFREPESCEMCVGVTEIPKMQGISASDFNANFLHLAKPVIILDGARNWSASKTFSFNFFKKLYENSEENSCQFFPYKTEFRSLQEVFQMEPNRARLEIGYKNWYVGWSNCNDDAGRVLRRFYDVPYFLPNTSENIALNWIFMGGPGKGAHMHVDNVQFPSWQAQIKGKKLWRLAPPPECYYKCQEMEIVVEPGEISTNNVVNIYQSFFIVVLDTNRWYHQTFVLPVVR